MSLASAFIRQARERPGHPALQFGDAAPVAYGELLSRAQRVAAGVAALDRVPARVGIGLDNCPELIEVFLGTVMAGATVVMLDPKWSSTQLASALDTAAPALLFAGSASDRESIEVVRVGGADAEYPAWLAGWPEREPLGVDPHTPFLIGFTSGTTGQPRAFIRNQASWLASLEASRIEFGIGPGDTVLIPGPLSHGLGLYAAVEGLSSGATLHVARRFDAGDAMRTLRDHRVSTLVAVPTILVGIARAAEREASVLPTLRRVIASGAKLAPDVEERLRASFPEALVLEYYGASELSFVSVRSSREAAPPESVGRAFAGVSLEVRSRDGRALGRGEVGTVWVASAMLSDGYVGGGDGTGFRAEAGWASVGDRGSLDESGWLHLVGREGDMLISGGLNVYPAEVEAALRACPAVAEAVVFGLDDAYWGQAVCAVLRWREGGSATTAELRAWCRSRLEAYKTPRRYFAARDLPLTGSGKIARQEVVDRVRAGAFEEVAG